MAKNITNDKSNTLISGTSGDDTISNGDWLSIDCFGGSKVTINGKAGNDRLYNDSNGSLSAVYGGEGADTISNYAAKAIIYGEAGKDYLYNYHSSASLTSIYGGEGEDNISNYGYCCKIDGGDGADTISNQGSEVTIDGGSGYDYIVNYYSYSSLTAIYGGDGADTIDNAWASMMTLDGGNGADVIKNGADKVTITGGKGDDKIVLYENGREALLTYNSGDGNDSIEGFNEMSTLSISDANFSTTKIGNNILVTVDEDAILLVGAADLSKVNIKGTKLETALKTVTNSDKSVVTVNSAVVTIDATARTKAVKLKGNTLDNSIRGGSGNDSISSGKGADTLWGGAGNDTLRGGNDVIFGFDSKDTLTLDSMDFTTSYKNKAVTLTFEEGSVTFKNFSATTFHINDDTYKISGSKFVKN